MSGLAHSDLRFDSRAKQVGHRNRLLVSGWREHVSERAQPIFGLLHHRHVFLYLWIIEFADVPSQVPSPIAVVTDNGPRFRGGIYAEVFRGEDPLLRHVRTRVRSSQTNGVVERFFGSLKYEHRFRHLYNTIRPHQALADRTPAQVYTGPGGGPDLVSA